MDTKEAYKLLGLEIGATKDEIEKNFRNLAHKTHPDHGGTDESMTALNEARFIALQILEQPTTPALVQAVQAAIAVVSARQERQQHLELRAAKTQEQFRFQSTNRLRRYRQIATILGALSVVALFVSKELPIADFLLGDPPSSRLMSSRVDKEELMEMPAALLGIMSEELMTSPRGRLYMEFRDIPMEVAEYLETMDKNSYESRKRDINRAEVLVSFVIGLFALVCAGLSTSRIDRVEREIRELEEQTETKTEMYILLQDILREKIHQSWTLREMADAISQWVGKPRAARASGHHKANEHVIRVMGLHRFAQILLDRAQQIGLVSVLEEFGQDGFVEHYSIASDRQTPN